ncbi:MAG TPA: peroxide stress protein YaaA [Mariprofundaceae bacterium]|nr:peroxide stress protein YaaA [Mariprofundaceae bacterium]
MLIVISPAKKLDFDSQIPDLLPTTPRFLDQAEALIRILRTLSTEEIGALMKISPKLAELNLQRYRAWSTPFTPENARPVLFVFRGDVYQALDADTLSADEVRFAQSHLRILSGLYGLLRPLDLIQPYRLEMGTKLPNECGKDLYAHWDTAIAEALNSDQPDGEAQTLINLASNEYAKAIDRDRFRGRIITPQFKENKDGAYRIIGIHAKQARGLMSRYIIRHGLRDPEAIKQFNEAGYSYRPALSSGDIWVFAR